MSDLEHDSHERGRPIKGKPIITLPNLPQEPSVPDNVTATVPTVNTDRIEKVLFEYRTACVSLRQALLEAEASLVVSYPEGGTSIPLWPGAGSETMLTYGKMNKQRGLFLTLGFGRRARPLSVASLDEAEQAAKRIEALLASMKASNA